MKVFLDYFKCYNETCSTIKTYINKNYNDVLVSKPENADFIVCVGGDGTLINTVEAFHKYNIPIIGINAGTVGFMMNSNKLEEIDKIFQKDFKPELIDLHLMKVTVNDESFYAFNEVMIGGNMSSWINFNIYSENEMDDKLTGGGLIFSTAQGSTGINANNGGPILPLESNLWSITSDKTTKQLKHVVSPHDIEIVCTSRHPINLWCDGKMKSSVENNTTVKISESFRMIRLGFTESKRFLNKRRIM